MVGHLEAFYVSLPGFPHSVFEIFHKRQDFATGRLEEIVKCAPCEVEEFIM